MASDHSTPHNSPRNKILASKYGDGQRVGGGGKLCTSCRVWLPLADFRPSKQVASGLSSWCVLCHTLAQRVWRAKTPEYQAAYNARRRVESRKARPLHACPACNVAFSGRGDKVYCSDECKRKARKSRQRTGFRWGFDFRNGHSTSQPVWLCTIDVLGSP